MNNSELYHYGVLGMKWGVRKADALTKRVNKLETRRDKYRSKYGSVSDKYINTSKNLYITKQKLALQKSKNKNDSAGIAINKERLKVSKWTKKYGTSIDNDYSRSDMKRIYGKKLSDKELQGISIKESNKYRNKTKVKNVLRAIGGVTVTAALTAPVWMPIVKEGADFIKKVDLKTIRYNFRTGTLIGINKR